MELKKKAVSTAIVSALGLCIASPAHSTAVTKIVIQDVNGDGNSGGFRFGSINPETYSKVVGWTGDGDVGPLLAEGAANPTGSFTTGFIFSSTPFVPFTFGSGVNADIDGSNNLTFSSLDFGVNFQWGAGIDFVLPPDPGTLDVNWVRPTANANEKLVSFQWSHLITTAEDPSSNFAGFNARWIVEGTAFLGPPNQVPDCSAAVASIDNIRPPNRKLVSIDVLGVTDPDGDPVTITIDRIFQDEPVDALGGGCSAPDGAGVGTSTAYVRAERSGTKKLYGNGRFYHIGFTADDDNGATCSGEVLVIVPHDQGTVPIDDGAIYDSTLP